MGEGGDTSIQPFIWYDRSECKITHARMHARHKRGSGAFAPCSWHARLYQHMAVGAHIDACLCRRNSGVAHSPGRSLTRAQTQGGASDLCLRVFRRYNEIIVASPLNGPTHLDQAWASCGRLLHRRPASSAATHRVILCVCRQEPCKDSLPGNVKVEGWQLTGRN